MSRAVRRQQQTAPKEAPQRKTRSLGFRGKPAMPTTRGAKTATAPRSRFSVRTPGWITDIWSELKKVSWPTRDETFYLTTVVIIVTLAVGSVLGGIDLFFNWMIDRLLLR